MAVNVVDPRPNRKPGDWHKPDGQMIGGGLTGGVNVGLAHRGNGGGNGPGNQPGLLSAFLPGQQAALAQQLNQGFGGGLNQWSGILGQAYSNMHIPQNPLGYPRPGHGDKGKDDGKGGDGHDNGDDGTTTTTNTDQLYGWGRGAPMMAGNPQMMQQPTGQMPQTNVGQMPLNSVNGPAQPNLMFGQQPLNPQMLAFLRQRLMGGQ